MTRPGLAVAWLTMMMVGRAPVAVGDELPPCQLNDGIPFGKTTDADAAVLAALAKRHGMHLELEVRKATAGDRTSLTAVF